MAESRMAADDTMAASVNDITRHGLGCSWDTDGTQHRAADTYATLGTKDTMHRGSGSKGRCGKRESELAGE